MILKGRLWRAGLAAVGGLSGALMAGLLSYAQDLTPRPEPGPLTATSVPLYPAYPGRMRVGALDYAGGLMLSAGSSSRLGGLSGLQIEPIPQGVSVTAVSDEGDIARFTAMLDAQGRLTGAGGLTMAQLHEDGAILSRDKARGDSEDIARADGRFYISFEADNRVLAMADPFDPGAAVARIALPAAALALPTGEGLEALAAAEIGGRPMLALGAEGGPVWLCPRPAPDADGCRRILKKPPAPAFRLTSLAHLPGGADFVALYRAFDPLRGWRARIEYLAAGADGYRSTTLAALSPPMTVDNMEGIAVTPLPGGAGWRLYLVSDDNFRDDERTLLLAFDWRRRP